MTTIRFNPVHGFYSLTFRLHLTQRCLFEATFSAFPILQRTMTFIIIMLQQNHYVISKDKIVCAKQTLQFSQTYQKPLIIFAVH